MSDCFPTLHGQDQIFGGGWGNVDVHRGFGIKRKFSFSVQVICQKNLENRQEIIFYKVIKMLSHNWNIPQALNRNVKDYKKRKATVFNSFQALHWDLKNQISIKALTHITRTQIDKHVPKAKPGPLHVLLLLIRMVLTFQVVGKNIKRTTFSDMWNYMTIKFLCL